MEVIVCNKLSWELGGVTPYAFLCQYCADLAVLGVLPAQRVADLLQVGRALSLFATPPPPNL